MEQQQDSEILEFPYFEYYPGMIWNNEKWFDRLMQEIELEQHQLTLFGKTYNEPRLTAVYGKESVLDRTYTYSKSVRKLLPMTHWMKKIHQLLYLYTEIDFDFVLVNLYRDGSDKVGWHSDDEPMMDCSNIASVSFGAERVFKFREKESKKLVWKKPLGGGSLVWMKPGCQENLEHEVPKTSKPVGKRLNLTFRKFK
jgi:alkylated DNA repair dioxygenase AlkB